jgi:hypothetical protein
MQDSSGQEDENVQGVSRRDFLKLCSLMLGGLVLPPSFTSTFEPARSKSNEIALNPKTSFQWQNEILCKTIYPMREQKLRDVLIYYMEVDVWSQYKDKDVNTLKDELYEYKKVWELNAAAAQREYAWLRDYFLTREVRGYYSNFHPIDEEVLTELNNLHALFVSWPKDIRNERKFVGDAIAYWERRIKGIRDWIKSRTRRHQGMNPAHPKYIPEGEELKFKENTSLPMAEQELDKLHAFLATYDKIEERKFAWYKLSKTDPNFKIPEAAFITTYPPEKQITLRDIAYWKVEDYTNSLAQKNQFELLDMINQRFRKEPKRYPAWLQYMIVHFSGMRYASAHGSWADPRDLLVRLRSQKIEAEISALDDATVEKRCKEKVAAYEGTGGVSKPKLALAQEKTWRDQIGWHLPNLKAGPKDRRRGLTDLTKLEDAYEIMSTPSQEILATLLSMKETFPRWAWKEIVKLTPLRVTEVSDLDWETLTPQEIAERDAQESKDLRAVINAWKNNNAVAWRAEHGRTQELIVTRLVCNETAEHSQHIRGQLPPGGLAARPKWYLDAESKLLPGAYFVRPRSENDYTQGASILWLRFVSFSSSNPNEWQIAKSIQTKQKDGLLAEFMKNGGSSGWTYSLGAVTTRSRTTITADKQKVVETQWLRWIHEATVAEVAETADGMMVLTFETALPGGNRATSAVGLFKNSLKWHLSDGTEDQYNRSFVGYIPDGQIPVEPLKTMLDWNRIFRK